MQMTSRKWYHELSRYHWFVLAVAALGWLFDTMDQQIFALVRVPAMNELLAPSPGVAPEQEQVNFYGPLATGIFLMGWAVGGLAFGVLGDRIGRAKTMLWTILIYSVFTGLSALSVSFWDFAAYRFLTGLGVGGEWAVGIALVAEAIPERARPFALGLLQALSVVGNISAALLNMGMGFVESSGGLQAISLGEQPIRAWRLMFLVGTVPALLAIVIRARLKEPERWQAVAASTPERSRLGSYGELFSDPVLRRNALVGLVLAFAGVVGLWGIGFFSFDLFNSVFSKQFAEGGLDPTEVRAKVSFWLSITSILQYLGGAAGIWAFVQVAHYLGRRPTFAISFLLAMASTMLVFGYLSHLSQIFWMIPLMGFCQMSLFGGYAIYFPELFPTRLRSTGTSFCYNVGRFVAAIGPFTFGYLTSSVFADRPEPMRAAAVVMSSIFLLGLAVLPFAPETKGHPLPD